MRCDNGSVHFKSDLTNQLGLLVDGLSGPAEPLGNFLLRQAVAVEQQRNDAFPRLQLAQERVQGAAGFDGRRRLRAAARRLSFEAEIAAPPLDDVYATVVG